MKKREDNLYQRTGIYAIHCLVNDKMYIGQTEMNFGDRRDNHYALLNNNKHHIEDLQNDWNEYGKENFEFIVLHDLQDGENITKIEEKYIKQYKDKNQAYNRAYGGIKYGGLGFHLSEDAKRTYKDLDIRFANDKLSILIETKQNLLGKDLKDGIK